MVFLKVLTDSTRLLHLSWYWEAYDPRSFWARTHVNRKRRALSFNMSWRNHMRIVKCPHLLDPFYTSPDKCSNGRIFYMRKSVYTEPCKLCYRLRCYLPCKNLPALVTCKRGLINIETDNLDTLTTQEYNSLLPVDICRSKHLCFISLLFRIHNTNYVAVKKS